MIRKPPTSCQPVGALFMRASNASFRKHLSNEAVRAGFPARGGRRRRLLEEMVKIAKWEAECLT